MQIWISKKTNLDWRNIC